MNKKNIETPQEDRRKNDSQEEAIALAKGLRRRREDKINDRFYYSMIALLGGVLLIFFVGSFFIS